MPEVPYELFETALKELVALDNKWVPRMPGSALYLRPFVFASEARFGVKVSEEYRFLIVTGPVPTLYAEPIRVKVERKYIRAAKGGTGYAKCAGNYGGAFYPTQLAKNEGFDQVIWTDSVMHEYVEESGTMNLAFVIDGKLVTPPVSDSILDGVTRDSLLEIAIDMGIQTEVRPLAVSEIIHAFENGTITEASGIGTAVVVAPISSIGIDGISYQLPSLQQGSIMARLKSELDAIRTGNKEDKWNWNEIV
jgi:branched-chain amino acid aminotransferase